MIDKKEIRKQYKETVQPLGVYQFKNIVNGKIFIGYSKNLRAKENSYKFQATLGAHVSSELQKDYNELGGDKFIFEVLDRLEPKPEGVNYDYTSDLETLEELWLEKLQPYGDKGYNIPKKK